jgi:hypothetical protein
MADNVELDPGSGGATVATDDAGAGGHVQIIKLAISADGSATVIPADADNGLDVDVTRVQGTVTVDGSGVTQPVSGTVGVTGVSTAANQTTVIGHLDGVEGLLTTIDADTGNIVTSVQTLDNAISGNEMQVDVVAALPSGTNNIGDVDVASIAAGDNNIGNVDIASAIPAGNNNIGDVDVASIAAGTNTIGGIRLKTDTSGGITPSQQLDIDETEDEIKGTAATLYGWYLYNDGASEVYVKFYNATAANVTVGSTTPLITLGIPAGSGANVFSDIGIAFGTALTVAATTGAAVADTGAPANNQVIGTIFYA